jgi:hypothetical protein
MMTVMMKAKVFVVGSVCSDQALCVAFLLLLVLLPRFTVNSAQDSRRNLRVFCTLFCVLQIWTVLWKTTHTLGLML